MKYLKSFQTTAAYNAAKPNLILPNVSLITENNKVEYNPSSPTPPTPTYESVDLGLPSGTLWAKYNVGATSETEYGNYYEWGAGAKTYQETGGYSDLPGYDENGNLVESADTAVQVWGGNWHMPTSAQCKELTANTTYEWTTINGVNGGKFTAKDGSGNYIFIPAAGGYYEGSLYDVGEGCCFYTTFIDDNEGYVYSICLNSHGCSSSGNMNFHYGYIIRAVIG